VRDTARIAREGQQKCGVYHLRALPLCSFESQEEDEKGYTLLEREESDKTRRLPYSPCLLHCCSGVWLFADGIPPEMPVIVVSKMEMEY
jgi:hypothetical protein